MDQNKFHVLAFSKNSDEPLLNGFVTYEKIALDYCYTIETERVNNKGVCIKEQFVRSLE